MIVITDGQSNDSGMLKNAASEAEAKNIIRFAIGVSCLPQCFFVHHTMQNNVIFHYVLLYSLKK